MDYSVSVLFIFIPILNINPVLFYSPFIEAGKRPADLQSIQR